LGHLEGKAWQVETIEETEASAAGIAGALDAADNPHVAYRVSKRQATSVQFSHKWWQDFKYGYAGADGEWTSELLEEGYYYYAGPTTNNFNWYWYGEYAKLAIDPAGEVHLAHRYHEYYTPADIFIDYYYYYLTYHHTVGGEWTSQSLDGDGCSDVDLALDPDGAPYIAYQRSPASTPYWWPKGAKELGLRVRGGGHNVLVDADAIARHAIAVDGDGNVHTLHYREEPYTLVHATNATGEWTFEIIDEPGEPAANPDLVADAAGALHGAYHDAVGGGLRYATDASGGWTTEAVDPPVALAADIALAVDDGGFVHIVYYDGTDSDVKYATNLNGDWQTFTIDAAGSVGLDLDIALDTQGAVHAFYTGEDAVWRAIFPVGFSPGR
jgi:hypothetical protein